MGFAHFGGALVSLGDRAVEAARAAQERQRRKAEERGESMRRDAINQVHNWASSMGTRVDGEVDARFVPHQEESSVRGEEKAHYALSFTCEGVRFTAYTPKYSYKSGLTVVHGYAEVRTLEDLGRALSPPSAAEPATAPGRRRWWRR